MGRPEAFGSIGGFGPDEDPALGELDEVIALNEAAGSDPYNPPAAGKRFGGMSEGDLRGPDYLGPTDPGIGNNL